MYNDKTVMPQQDLKRSTYAPADIGRRPAQGQRRGLEGCGRKKNEHPVSQRDVHLG